MFLPTEPIKAISQNPKTLIIFSKPKTGKTTAASMLEGNLIVDLEDGAYFLTCLKIQVKTVAELAELVNAIKEKTTKDGKPPYKYITIDSATVLEDVVLPLAAQLYRNTTMGKNWDGDDVRKLANGAGYLYTRMAFQKVLDSFRTIAPHLIIIAHTKEAMINHDGKELTEMSLDLSGKLARIVSADADAIGYMYRVKNKTILNFKSGEDVIVGSRADHLRNKEIVLLESDEDGNLKANWDQIYLPE